VVSMHVTIRAESSWAASRTTSTAIEAVTAPNCALLALSQWYVAYLALRFHRGQHHREQERRSGYPASRHALLSRGALPIWSAWHGRAHPQQYAASMRGLNACVPINQLPAVFMTRTWLRLAAQPDAFPTAAATPFGRARQVWSRGLQLR
jgi:hypothetical protein